MNFFLLSSVIFLTQFAYAQTKAFDEVSNYYNVEKQFNGTIIVATDGKIDYLKAIGVSDRKENIPINTQTKFRIASVTKAFTAVLILQLYQQGKIDLYIPFGKYYPDYKGDAKSKITIEHLLTYSSAIPDSAGNLELNSFTKAFKIDEYIDKYYSANVVGTAGEKSIYSNTDYIILTKIIENVTKKTFEKALADNILKPLKMKNTGMLNTKSRVKDLTNSYSINDSTKTITLDEPYFIENFFGSGAMYSTIEDLLKFDVGIFQHKLLNKPTTDLMIKPNAKLNNVAFGVWYADGYGTFSKPFIYRTGGILGACSNWIHTIDNKKSIIVFNNTNGTNLYQMSEQLYLVSTGRPAAIINTKK